MFSLRHRLAGGSRPRSVQGPLFPGSDEGGLFRAANGKGLGKVIVEEEGGVASEGARGRNGVEVVAGRGRGEEEGRGARGGKH